MNLASPSIGDTVVITDLNHPTERRKIVAVGRRYFTVSGGEQFDKVTGRVNDRWGHRHLKTMAAHELSERAHEARKMLRSFGVEVPRAEDEKAIAIAAALAPLMAAELLTIRPIGKVGKA